MAAESEERVAALLSLRLARRPCSTPTRESGFEMNAPMR